MSATATVCNGGADIACADEASLGGIVRLAGKEFLEGNGRPLHVHRVLSAIGLCRTAALGGHRFRCRKCGGEHKVPHSCGNRHCPGCQGKEAIEWLEKQRQALLPVGYFHLVFTLPHEFNPLVRFNQSTLYRLLFTAVSETLLEFGRNELGGRIGFTAVLHTWSQTLLDHYHLHVIVPAGALCDGESRWKSSHPRYLFPVRALSKVYQAKFLSGIERLFAKGKLQMHDGALGRKENLKDFLKKSARKAWNVYAKRPFAGPEAVLRYLSGYTHRAAISNRRILEVDASKRTVLFCWKDYADSNRKKTMRLGFEEFLRRFCLHILPERFVRIRHYGFLSNNSRAGKVPLIRRLLGAEPEQPPIETAGEADSEKEGVPGKCPHCGSTDLELIEIVRTPQSRPRAPPNKDPPKQ